nr:STAS domain-containing protein [Rubripirellula sp.]
MPRCRFKAEMLAYCLCGTGSWQGKSAKHISSCYCPTTVSLGGFMSQAEVSKTGFGGECRVVSLSHESLNKTGAAARCTGILTELGEQAGVSCSVPALLVDMTDIERITSEGLNELIALNSEARGLGVSVRLLEVCTSVRDVFKLTRLERMFEFGSLESSTES